MEDLFFDLCSTNTGEPFFDFGQNRMYWVGGGRIQFGDFDATNVSELWFGCSQYPNLVCGVRSVGLAADLINRKFYFAGDDYPTHADAIWRMGLNGADPQKLVSLPSRAVCSALALNAAEDQVYWAEVQYDSSYTITTSQIARANLDGSNSTPLVEGLDFVNGLALDLIARQMYWLDSGSERFSVPTLMVLELKTSCPEASGLTRISLEPCGRDHGVRFEDVSGCEMPYGTIGTDFRILPLRAI
jgi:hypothetical protein